MVQHLWKSLIMYSVITVSLPILDAAAQDTSESIFAIVQECDLLAAHPDDPQRVAPGVTDETIVPRLAEQACRAVLETPDAGPRHSFQLGRALLELERREEAVRTFERAASEGSAISYLFLGDAEQFGWIDAQDGDAALVFYETARDKGLMIADIAISQVVFDPNIFTTGAMLEALVSRQIDAAVKFAQNIYARSYLYGFALELSGRCGSFLEPVTVGFLEEYRFPQGWSAASEDSDRLIGRQDILATYDAEILVDRHGCNGTVIEAVAESFNEMLRRLNG